MISFIALDSGSSPPVKVCNFSSNLFILLINSSSMSLHIISFKNSGANMIESRSLNNSSSNSFLFFNLTVISLLLFWSIFISLFISLNLFLKKSKFVSNLFSISSLSSKFLNISINSLSCLAKFEIISVSMVLNSSYTFLRYCSKFIDFVSSDFNLSKRTNFSSLDISGKSY